VTEHNESGVTLHVFENTAAEVGSSLSITGFKAPNREDAPKLMSRRRLAILTCMVGLSPLPIPACAAEWRLLKIPAHELRVPIDPVQGAQ
jgi:hypothetical protein